MNPALGLKDKGYGYLVKNNEFQILGLSDGTFGAFPPNISMRYFRGENKDYDEMYPCVPSIFRTSNPEELDSGGNRKDELIAIDELKICEFALILEQFPQVKYALEDYCNLDYRALAQHYELKTDLIDLTCDIVAAAFFATNSYNKNHNNYVVCEEGIGCIRQYVPFMPEDLNGNFRLIGLQPFERPGRQSAFALRLIEGENFADLSGKVMFKQNSKYNNVLRESFYRDGKNILFPDEEITDVANLIKESKTISQMAIENYCLEHEVKEVEILEILNTYNYKVSDSLAYKLTRQQRRKLEREYEGRPYGDVRLTSRLMAFSKESSKDSEL